MSCACSCQAVEASKQSSLYKYTQKDESIWKLSIDRNSTTAKVSRWRSFLQTSSHQCLPHRPIIRLQTIGSTSISTSICTSFYASFYTSRCASVILLLYLYPCGKVYGIPPGLRSAPELGDAPPVRVGLYIDQPYRSTYRLLSLLQ